MTIVGFVAILLMLVALSWAFVERDNKRLAIFAMMALAHVATAVIYYFYVQVNDADTRMYYMDPYGFHGTQSGLGTWFTIDLVQTMRSWLGGSYLDYFLIFQTVGFWGLTFVARTLEEVCSELRVDQPSLLYLSLFLPGLYFWTSAIGKDPPLFLASALAMWAMLDIRTRWLAFATAMLVAFPFRPHISLIALVAMIGAVALDRHTGTAVRIALGVVVAAGIALVAATLRQTLNVDVTSSASIGSFLQSQTETAGEMSNSIVGESYLVKVFSLLFRPFFVDAGGFFGLVASFENIFNLIIFFTFISNWRLLTELFRKVMFVRYALLFAVMLLAMLSVLYYNVGLGLRQKAMVMPALLALFGVVSQIAAIRRRDRAARIAHYRTQVDSHSLGVTANPQLPSISPPMTFR